MEAVPGYYYLQGAQLKKDWNTPNEIRPTTEGRSRIGPTGSLRHRVDGWGSPISCSSSSIARILPMATTKSFHSLSYLFHLVGTEE